MKLLNQILPILQAKASTPVAFGWFHMMFWILSILLGIWLAKKFRNPDAKTVKRILLAMGIICVTLEIYKQIVFSFSLEGGKLIFDYQWYAFPFQFCSMPMYVQLLAGIIRKGRVHNALCAFLATYAIFAGICVMIYPGDVFTELVGVNVQTMVCHASMLTIGIFLFGSGYVKTELKTILRAIPVFATGVAMASVMNELTVKSGILNGEEFNMFYISRHFAPHLPVYSSVQQVVPYPWCLIIYVLGFSIAACAVLFIAMGIHKAISAATKKRKHKTA